MHSGSVVVPSPLGPLTLFAVDGEIVALEWGKGADDSNPPPVLQEAARQLEAYFDGKRRDFALPLNPHGTAFQQKVWNAMRRIPCGETRSYGEIAREIGCGAPRPIGGACGKNPIPVIIPCHRILGSGKSFGGYSGEGGLDTKRWLLRLEGALS